MVTAPRALHWWGSPTGQTASVYVIYNTVLPGESVILSLADYGRRRVFSGHIGCDSAPTAPSPKCLGGFDDEPIGS